MNKQCANVLGVRLDALNLVSAAQQIVDAAEQSVGGYVCVTGVHGVTVAQDDSRFKTILNTGFLNVPDGMPMSWVGWIQGFKEMDRVYGPDLMLKVTDMSVERGLTHFYCGGKAGVADLLAEKMVNRFPSLRIVGTYCPPFRPLNQEELASLKKRLLDLKPDFIWIGLSTPKQEQFAAQMLQELGCGLFLAVGAAFDFHAGLVSQAPGWMQRSGLEWFYRLCTEPRRLWKRYLVNNPLFLFRIFCQLSGLRKYRIEQDVRAHSGSSSSP